jgi:hypothetical protein
MSDLTAAMPSCPRFYVASHLKALEIEGCAILGSQARYGTFRQAAESQQLCELFQRMVVLSNHKYVWHQAKLILADESYRQ